VSGREPEIVVNGVRLTEAQALAVRVAVTSFRMGLTDPEHMAALGPIGPLYDARLAEVELLACAPPCDGW